MSPAPPASTSPPWRGRFAPTPTGPLHFGSLIAALASYLEARSRGGQWLVRIEDLDHPRAVTGAADAILRALDRLGLGWDGEPLYQSTRTGAYREAEKRLREAGLTFRCSCSRRELAASAPRGPAGRVYPGICRGGPARPLRARTVRIRVDDRPVGFADRLQGPVTQHLPREVGDFVIRRADGLYAYQHAVVVDDAYQGINDVVRGADLLASTPRQVYLQRLLGLPRPSYLHLPLAVDGAGAKLSKSAGAAAIDLARPARPLVDALAFLGQAPPAALRGAEPPEVLAWALAHWRPSRIPRRPAPAPGCAPGGDLPQVLRQDAATVES